MTKQPKVTIVMTVYNGQRYIEDSIKAIYKSDYKNYELVCIDDGSTDESHTICHKFNLKYDNFKYYRQENHGLAYSRNLGVHLATGEYITFVDADDLISPHMITYLIQMINKFQADIAYVKLQTFLRETEIGKTSHKIKEEVCTTEQALERYFDKGWGNVCGGIFSRELFHNVKFPVGLIYEDNVAKLQLFINASRIVLTNNPLYYYRKTNDSITTKKVSFKNLDILRVGYKQEIIIRNSQRKISNKIKKKNYQMIANTCYELLDNLLQIDEKWPRLSKIVPMRYIMKILFFGLMEKPADRVYICFRTLKKYLMNSELIKN